MIARSVLKISLVFFNLSATSVPILFRFLLSSKENRNKYAYRILPVELAILAWLYRYIINRFSDARVVPRMCNLRNISF